MVGLRLAASFLRADLISRAVRGDVLKEIKRVFEDTAVYGVGSLLPKAAGIILVPIYTRFLLPSDYGIMSLASIITTIAGTTLILGQNGALTLYLRSTQSDASEEDRRRLLFSVTVFTLAFATAMILLVFPFGPAITTALFGTSGITFYPYIAIALVTALIGMPLMLLQAVNRAKGKARVYSTFQIASFAVNTTFTIWFVVAWRQGALGSLKGTFVAALALAPVALWFLARQMTPRFSAPWLKRSLAFGLPLVPHALAGWVLTFSDRTILGRYTSLREVGLYSLAYNISMLMNLISQSINQAWGPIYYDLASTDDGRLKLPRLTTVYAVTVVFAGMAYMLFAREALMVLASPRYWQAAELVPVIVAAYVCFAMYSVVSTGIFFAKKTKWVAGISGAAAVVNIGLNLWLIPRYGMWAAAVNTLIAYALMAVVARYLTGRLYPGSFENRRMAALVAIFFVVFAANLALQSAGLPLAVLLALKVGLLAASLGAFVLFGVITVGELRQVLDLVEKRRRRNRTVDETAALQAQEAEGMAAEDSDFEGDGQ
jgi:O-antigen/teichoic acid export membrane protein